MKTTEHNAHFNGTTHDDVVMKYCHDIKGQLLEVRDPLDRACFKHLYDTAGNNLWTEHLDSGVKTLVVDAQGKPLYSTDAKGAEVYTAYDALNRPTDIWARDAAAEAVTLRQHMVYGDAAHPDPLPGNHLGKLWKHYDEAGLATITAYDFKGNPLEKVRQVVADTEFTGQEKYVVDWTGLAVPLETKEYVTSLLYDGLNRVRKSIYPEDVESARKELIPTYNRAGALQAITFDGTDYVHHIAYNAKGQRVLLAMGNGMMTRYAYDPLNYRLLRILSEKYVEEDYEYETEGGVQQDLGYLYDLAGNIVGIRDQAPANSSAEGPGDLLKQFAYDPLNRLLSATGRESTQAPVLPEWDASIRNHDHTATNTYTRAYQFDKLGNVLQEQHTADGNPSNSFTKTFQYHATEEHNKLLSFTVGSNTYAQAFDANGNLITENIDRHHQWGYDDKLRLFKIDAGGGASKWAHYRYDTGGTRVKKVVNKSGGIQEVTICIDGVFEECYVKESGTINSDKHWNTLHVLDGNSRLATVRVGEDEDDDTPPVKYNLEDHLGNSSVMVDDEGDLVNREEYYPFGDTCFGAFAKKRYRYNGKEKDNESGLYNYGMRYYAPWMCRFVSVDPLATKYPHYTPYQYAGNKPINFIDIDGLEEGQPQAQQETTWQQDVGDYAEWLPAPMEYNVGLAVGIISGAQDVLGLAWDLTGGAIVDMITGDDTIYEETFKSFGELYDLVSKDPEGWSKLWEGLKAYATDMWQTASGEKGAYEAGMSHGKMAFEVLAAVFTGGAALGATAFRKALVEGAGAIKDVLKATAKELFGGPTKTAKKVDNGGYHGMDTLDDSSIGGPAPKSQAEIKRRKAYEQFSPSWSRVDLNDILKKFGVDKTKGEVSEDLVKTRYTNPQTGIEIVVDNENSYLRIFDMNKKQWVDVSGKVPSTGKLSGEAAKDYVKAKTHFNF